jgi:hypothetical protein
MVPEAADDAMDNEKKAFFRNVEESCRSRQQKSRFFLPSFAAVTALQRETRQLVSLPRRIATRVALPAPFHFASPKWHLPSFPLPEEPRLSFLALSFDARACGYKQLEIGLISKASFRGGFEERRGKGGKDYNTRTNAFSCFCHLRTHTPTRH